MGNSGCYQLCETQSWKDEHVDLRERDNVELMVLQLNVNQMRQLLPCAMIRLVQNASFPKFPSNGTRLNQS